MDRRAEIDAFKSRINLTQYAAAEGYQLDRRKSSRQSVTMRRGASHLLITRAEDGHWVFCSVDTPGLAGSIVDLDQHLHGGSLGDVRKRLRMHLGDHSGLNRAKPSEYVRDVEPSQRDPAAVLRAYRQSTPAPRHSYLTDTRGIPASVLSDPIFEGRVRSHGTYGNALFPHYDRSGVCGFELKNRRFTGFANGGVKGLWCSRPRADDTRLVIAETAVDALSYAALFGTDRTRFVSTAGQLSPEQPELIHSAVEKLPSGGDVMAATDNDEAGTQLAERIEAIVDAVGGRPFRRHSPPEAGRDWNDVLAAKSELRPVRFRPGGPE